MAAYPIQDVAEDWGLVTCQQLATDCDLEDHLQFFSKLLYARLRPILDPAQPEDQTGFRPRSGVERALAVFDTMCNKSTEWGCDLWFASLDLKNAFDRVDHAALFRALHTQGVPSEYLAVLCSLYSSQRGCVLGGRAFPIERGDVTSPFVFNAVLEYAMK